MAEITPMIWRALERELLVWRRMIRGSLFAVFVQPVLFLAAMGVGLGGLVDERTADVAGFDYLGFVAPGLLVASAMLSVAGDGLWGVMAGVKWMGQYNSMVATTMSPGDVYGGHVLAAGVRAGVGAAAFLTVAVVFGAVNSWWAPLAVVVAAVLAIATVAVLATYSVRKESDDTFSIILRLGVMPLFLFSGTFFPIGQLPDALEPLAWLSPLFHAAEVARGATTGTLATVDLVHFAVLVVVAVAVFPVGIRRFAEKLTP